jgi:CheY-like chemotaxis protein/anti-sigma regulatory factor (Ser/Thr protein kinase)
LDLDETIPPVKGDPSALGSAIINLCVNAVDAMNRGGRVLVRTRHLTCGWVELTVIDNGEGMPSEVLARAMDPFFTTKPAGKGTGLGLSIVYATMKAHGGTVVISSQPGQGTTVALRFPPFGSEERTSSVAMAEVVHPKPAAHRILMVDDDPLVLEAIVPLLQSLGHTVTALSSGQEALDRVGAGLDVDLMIVDQNMPGLSGEETVTRMLAFRPNLPVLMASGYLASVRSGVVSSGGRVSTISKPFSRDELRGAIEAVDRASGFAQG